MPSYRGAAPLLVSWRGEGTSRRLKLAIVAGLDFGRTVESAEDLGRRGGLVAEPEDQDAGQHLFGRKQVEAAGLSPEIHLCRGCGVKSDIGQSIRKRGVACLIKGREPVVEEVAGGGVGDEAHLVARARKANQDGGVNGADVISRAGGHRSVAGIAQDDGVDLIWIVIVFLGWRLRWARLCRSRYDLRRSRQT